MQTKLRFLIQTPLALILTAEIALGSFLVIAATLIYAKLSDKVLNQEKIFFDTSITELIFLFRSPEMTEVMLFFSFLGSTFILGLAMVIIGVLFIKKYHRESLLFFLVVIMGGVVNTWLKFLVQRARPTLNPLIVEPYYSFPSGHSMNSFVFYMMLVYLTYHFTRNKKLTSLVFIVASLIIFMIGISRIYLGVHYPSDILGGYVAGVLWFVTILILDRTISLYGLFREYRKH